ncbi:acyl-CoA dehydrogenase family protein [Deinococcus radiodurans]|jgi:Acyl-CoA dehydrogenases|uniref:glutaryl-CoA dehydrogenase (ETF) n=1 Tax=Deinococcus radiodurans (strain ATCC 13939 / DSM 20539 / JCM 16871 / CCUG 27074 / LMG 4051 / NBRC 15346 / NCIMB 9279 / VKM B-1422 / R1) TaxID=243230 RepID=Q9RYH6_DEIRA|nr:acyl-CoA dehydrogenase family protein [Deinococcus radiodurans]AAF12445.1 glutaryl-CoA dehydrogenase [Deinococcus radiodurans R1 = ATCC 13939 = DSM 20539]ANC72847.1 acyl-CoA dehydrogenase [Deinococcus radiodurans R1 = ATCC 13939 = DSM 20539]QEM73120.1 glutaryl-CoA dehydrogenase [Deinococcus radiodurans]QIP30514.1 glutaryl-CoA dehydrogenase [Deinococcus radiodurans]QIP33429.1 glutaryl-CoA dehydrogenase [Deinococcus radiodurans]
MFDYFKMLDLVSPDERDIHAATRKFVDAEIIPHIGDWWEHESAPTRELMRKMGSLGLLGPTTPEQYGGAGTSYTAYGLICYELERADSGLRSAASVQGSLVMHPINEYGSEEQKKQWLPGLASGELIGCFGLTEPDGGSDPGGMRTRARKDGGDYVLNGSKMWITNSPLADVAVVWAKDDEDVVRGFIVPRDARGFSTPKIGHKMSLRASTTGEIVLEDCRIPAENLLPGSRGLKSPLGCLTSARSGIAWGAMGALESVLTASLEYAGSRTTFGRPIAARQLVQEKLAWMATQHSLGSLLAWRLGNLKDGGQMNYAQVSVAKGNNVRVALEGARMAREIHGGNGITTEYPVIRHMLNLETVDTYEGTHDIHTLIVGRDLTGQNALE